MSVDRKVILDKLVGFSIGQISKSQIYEWALSFIVSGEYESIIKNDKFTQEIFQFLIDIEKSKSANVPAKKVLDYFIQCLQEKKVFSLEDYKALIGDKSTPVVRAPEKQKLSQGEKPPVALGWLVGAAKIYALIFVACSILLNTVCLIKPDFLVKSDEIAPSAAEVGKEAFPHLIYGILILLAMSVKMPRVVFYAFIPVGIWGMFFYWSAATGFALKHGLSFLHVALLLIVVALPPTAAFFVLLSQWFNNGKIQSADEKK